MKRPKSEALELHAMEKEVQSPLWQSGDPSKPMSAQRAEQLERYQRAKIKSMSKFRGGGYAGRGDNPHTPNY